MEAVKIISRILAFPPLVLIWIYQKTISPDHGIFKVWFPYGFCKFHPTCSQYAAMVLRSEGLLGIPKIIKRLVSCRPNALGGVDMP